MSEKSQKTQLESIANELPDGWLRADVLNFCTLVRGVSYKKGEASTIEKQGLIPLLRANNIDGELNFTDLQFVPKERVSDEQKLQVGDVVIAMSSGSKIVVGKAASLRNKWPGTFGAFCGVLRPTKMIDWLYFSYFFQTREYRSKISGLAAGVNINNIKRQYFEEIDFPLPPLAEQKRIAAKVEELLGHVNGARKRLAKVPAILKRFRQAVLAAACAGKLTEDWRENKPEDNTDQGILDYLRQGHRAEWETVELAKLKAKGKSSKKQRWKEKYRDPPIPVLDEVPEIPDTWALTSINILLSLIRKGMKTGPFGSMLKKSEHQQSGIPVLGIENISKMRFVEGSKIHITKDKAKKLSEFDALPGDILISRSGTVGEVCVVPEGLGEARISTNIMRVTLRNGSVLPIFFCYLFNGSPFVLRQVSHLCAGSTRDFLNQTILSSIVFPVPPLEEQKEIVRRVEELFKWADAIEKRLAAATRRVEKLTQAILAKAFRGELVPTEADLARKENRPYEPASELLARIQAEREKESHHTKTKKKTSRKKQRARKY